MRPLCLLAPLTGLGLVLACGDPLTPVTPHEATLDVTILGIDQDRTANPQVTLTGKPGGVELHGSLPGGPCHVAEGTAVATGPGRLTATITFASAFPGCAAPGVLTNLLVAGQLEPLEPGRYEVKVVHVGPAGADTVAVSQTTVR